MATAVAEDVGSNAGNTIAHTGAINPTVEDHHHHGPHGWVGWLGVGRHGVANETTHGGRAPSSQGWSEHVEMAQC